MTIILALTIAIAGLLGALLIGSRFELARMRREYEESLGLVGTREVQVRRELDTERKANAVAMARLLHENNQLRRVAQGLKVAKPGPNRVQRRAKGR